jgi:hypothetical protein
MVSDGAAVVETSGDMVIPLYDKDPFEAPYRPYATWTLIALNLVAVFAELASPDTDAVAAARDVALFECLESDAP